MKSTDKRAIIIGGSLSGLFTGILLRSIGWEVDIYERSSHTLASRGGGVVLQPDVLAAFHQAGVAYEAPLGVIANERLYLEQDGSIAQRMMMHQTLTSWNLLYGTMRRHLPTEHYHQGKTLKTFQQEREQVTATFTDDTQDTASLLIGADGPNSTVRSQLLPSYEPSYAGYVAYRGLVDEAELDSVAANLMRERFVFFQFPNSHILQYVIPGENESLIPGERRFNWVWYVNYDEATELASILTDKNGKRRDYSIPPGMMALDVEQQMRSYADQVLAPPFQQLVAATQEPFVQAILDLGVPQMAFDRVALVGDAAFVPRPHTAASVSKGAANAIALTEALTAQNHDVPKALDAWEANQLRLGMHLWKVGQELGERSQFKYGKERHEHSDHEAA
ncbi:2,6-dihydroxypyridine 3-monooxygenase [Acaryochloris thomasi RCC1774]|uniref:2,6-dihydroxypyridine 3-monooxygenase n=1 Tax=Acaryochloris thomasi RCC1774 TaxID=1764569 RepID=A0A2W1K0K8_9CYAN|nr:FAD binding domain-containing protein [Acaryochloris thomasi]PZD73777.1 2,6-dihydroxypyridine 3-monooxygenase [Acaryochloris thomasi RCC1774]